MDLYMYTYSERCRFDCLKHWASPSRLHASYWHANEAFPPSDQSTKHLEKSHNGFGVGRNLQPQNHLLIDLRLIDLKYIRPSNALNMSKIVQISTLSCCFPNHAVLLDINHAMTANTVQQNRLYAYHFFPAHVCTICSYIALALSDLTSSLPGHSGLLPPLPPLDSHRAGAICGCRSSKGARHSPGAVYGHDKCKIIQWNPIETILQLHVPKRCRHRLNILTWLTYVYELCSNQPPHVVTVQRMYLLQKHVGFKHATYPSE